ncbi:biotin carboxyl carrier protein [Sulfitobacter undariae]|uniref:Biotin carboxyl carrier protein n=1 Tax=Sulfitobacter undariae TaxID=1563671 RepID=A0A7W6E7Y7_9RHOB|nr:hypothetical protein [Sulfitobacter undariae]MBB3995859.1 biotin carboxyl carrier protein [Sulfitobacter undariae]
MAHILLRSPKGNEHYPAIIVRSHTAKGAKVGHGDVLYEIKTAQGRNLGIKASKDGCVISPPYPEGMTLHEQVVLAELDSDVPHAEAKITAKTTAQAAEKKPKSHAEARGTKPNGKPRKVMLRTPAPIYLYPLTVTSAGVEQGTLVSAGDTLYELRCANGREVRIPSPEAGQLASPAYPVGFQFNAPALLAEISVDTGKAEPEPSFKSAGTGTKSKGGAGPSNKPRAQTQSTPPQEKTRHDRHTRKSKPQTTTQSPKRPTDPRVLKAVERERDTTPSAFLRSFWTAETPDVRWGGFGPIFKMSLLFTAMLMGFQLVLRAITPDLELEALLLPAMGIAILSAFLTVRIVRHWRHRPSPPGLVFPLAGLAILGCGASIIPDREIYYATGFDPAEIPIEILGSISRVFSEGNPTTASSGTNSESSGKSSGTADDFYLERIGAKPLGGAKSRAAPPDLQNKFDDWINS